MAEVKPMAELAIVAGKCARGSGGYDTGPALVLCPINQSSHCDRRDLSEGGTMRLQLWRDGVFLGSIVRSAGSVFAYDPDGRPIGTFSDSDAAAAALLLRLPVAA